MLKNNKLYCDTKKTWDNKYNLFINLMDIILKTNYNDLFHFYLIFKGLIFFNDIYLIIKNITFLMSIS